MAADLEKQTKEIYAAFNAQDFQKFLSFHTDDVITESVADGSVIHGKEELRDFVNGYFVGFKDFKMELTSLFSSGNRQCEEWVISGTHTGGYQGLAATGKHISVRGILVREMKEGKTSRVSNYFDSATLMRQLGL
jgi:steroid delta-isomerase-like uncharacterized protein